jgi:hypothetical protein
MFIPTSSRAGKTKKDIKGKVEKMEGLEMGFGEDKGFKFLMTSSPTKKSNPVGRRITLN